MVYHLYLQGYYNIDLLGPIQGVYTDEPMYMVWYAVCGLAVPCLPMEPRLKNLI